MSGTPDLEVGPTMIAMRIVAGLVVSGALVLGTAAAPQNRAAPFMPIGVWYGGGTARPPLAPRHPAAERDAWRDDLRTIRNLGFNSVTSWIDWAGAEPRRGAYRFDALDQMLALAGDTQLRVILQLYPHIVPDWIRRQYPDAAVVAGPDAERDSPPETRVCFDHPGVRADLASFIGAVSERAARHPSFFALDLSIARSEDRSGAADARDPVCLCPHTQRRFREWLQRKYATLDALNGAWSTTFEDWERVEAPRAPRVPSYSDVLDWETFNAVRAHEDLQFMVRASAPRGQRAAIGHSDVPSIRGVFLGAGAPDDWWMSSAVDDYGTSIYPMGIAPESSWSPAALGAALDGIRSATRDRGWWLTELQAGQAGAGLRLGELVTAADLRLWAWAGLSRGARAIGFFAWYPMSSGPEAHSYGMVDLDGRLTDRARAAGRLAALVSRNPALFAPLRPRPSNVAILYNYLPCLTGATMRAACSAGQESMLGLYRALLERNIQMDFVHPDEIAAGRAAKYRAVFMGSPWMLQQPVADALAAYVRAGGTLVSEARPGWTDAAGRAGARIPGLGLDEVFGAREKWTHPLDAFDIVMERELDGPLSRLAGRTLPGKGLAEHLEISGTDVRVMARFPGEGGAPGDPAIVMSRYGKGRAVLIGSFPAAAFHEDPVAFRSSGDLLSALAESAGATSDVRIAGGDGFVEARFLESSAAMVLVALNHDTEPHEVSMTFPADTPEAIWLNLETGASVNFVAGSGGPTYRYRFEPRGVLVLMIKKDLR